MVGAYITSFIIVGSMVLVGWAIIYCVSIYEKRREKRLENKAIERCNELNAKMHEKKTPEDIFNKRLCNILSLFYRYGVGKRATYNDRTYEVTSRKISVISSYGIFKGIVMPQFDEAPTIIVYDDKNNEIGEIGITCVREGREMYKTFLEDLEFIFIKFKDKGIESKRSLKSLEDIMEETMERIHLYMR